MIKSHFQQDDNFQCLLLILFCWAKGVMGLKGTMNY